MKIAMLGAGALGCAIGAALTEGGHETWLIARSPSHVGAMCRDGLQVDDTSGSRRVRVRATTQADDVGVADLVIVLVKSFHTDAAMRGAQGLIGPDTLVLSLQNGLGHEDILADVVGRERVLAGKTYVGGVRRGDAHIESGVAGKLTFIGELDGRITPRVQAIADIAVFVFSNEDGAELRHHSLTLLRRAKLRPSSAGPSASHGLRAMCGPSSAVRKRTW